MSSAYKRILANSYNGTLWRMWCQGTQGELLGVAMLQDRTPASQSTEAPLQYVSAASRSPRNQRALLKYTVL